MGKSPGRQTNRSPITQRVAARLMLSLAPVKKERRSRGESVRGNRNIPKRCFPNCVPLTDPSLFLINCLIDEIVLIDMSDGNLI